MSARPRFSIDTIGHWVDAWGCWDWLGSINSYGYGRAFPWSTTFMAHRLVWETLVGPIPDGMQLDHLCRNRRCVNPDHLEPVTVAENVRRSISSNGSKVACKHGHAYTPENTYLEPKTGKRHCVTCRRATSARAAAMRKAERHARRAGRAA